MSKRTLNVIAVIGLLLGLLWVLQGSNLVGGSVMSGQSIWLYLGIGLMVIAAVVGGWVNFRR